MYAPFKAGLIGGVSSPKNKGWDGVLFPVRNVCIAYDYLYVL